MKERDEKGGAGSEPEDVPFDAVNGGDAEAEEQDEVTKLREERDRYLNLLQRTRADFLNYQKKAQRELEEANTYANAKFARGLLEVVDNLSRALAQSRSGSNVEALKSGVELVQQLLLKVLADNKVVPVDAMGKPFDPQWHEAIMQEERSDVPPMTVIDELVKGYSIGDRLLRPSVVRVSKAPHSAGGSASERASSSGS
jgi:molecular chaperone GrpE